ncbi:hypothetical protein F5146DRAFT_388205 [Armillaria mellea]|nr:hypothetical protein F5146DRAFT_388205 [Armillaria mellea]
MSGFASLVQVLSPRWWTTCHPVPVYHGEASPSWVWVEELSSLRDCASNIDSPQQDHCQLLASQCQQQIRPGVHEKLERNQLGQMLEEARKANTLIQRDISILEATSRELSESVLAPPEYRPQYPTIFPTYRSIWTVKPDEILYGSGLISPFLPPLVRHETRQTPSSTSPGWPRLNIPPHSQSPVQNHVSSPQPASHVRANSVDMLYKTQLSPPATVSTESVMFQDVPSPQVQDLPDQRLTPRTPPPATISTENVGMCSPLRHEAPDLPAQRPKYTIPAHKQGFQVKSTQRFAKPSSRSRNARQQERRPGALHKRKVTSAPLAQTTEPRIAASLLLERPEMHNRFPTDCRGLENPRLGDPASLWCRYYSIYIAQIPLHSGIRLTPNGLPVYNDVVGWRAIVCLRPPGGMHLEDSTKPYVLFTEALMTLFSGAGGYLRFCKRLRLKRKKNGVLSRYKGPFIVDNPESMVEEVAKHLNNCGVTVEFAEEYILPYVTELKRQRG